MQRIKALALAVLCLLIASLLVAELKTPSLTANCAECGDGPKDKKCPKGQKCADGKCVKK
jgi:hypothetical protein